MKRFVIYITICLMTLTSPIWAEDKLTINAFIIKPGATDKEFAISLDNDVSYAAFQFDLYLPDGITITESIPIRSRLPESTTLQMRKQSDGCYRFIAVAHNLSNIIGTSDSIIIIKVSADSHIGYGDISGSFENIKLSKANGEGKRYEKMTFPIKVMNIIPGDVNGDGVVTAQDASLVLQLVAGKLKPTSEGIVYEAANINGDDSVTIQDALLILQKIAGKTSDENNE